MKNFSWLSRLTDLLSARGTRRTNRSARHRYRAESLEARLVLAAPTLAELPNVTLRSGSPLMIPLDGADADGQMLTFSASSTNSSVQTVIQPGRTGLEMVVDGFGTMRFHLFEDKAPRAVAQITELAASGFYDGSTFHRVINNFVIQGGDPNGDPPGTGGSSLGDFDDQFHVDLQHNRTGILSMAKSLDDTNDSQFFITEGAQRALDAQHSIFGLLVEGESVREAISNVTTVNPPTDDRPITDVVVSEINVYTDLENGVLMLKAPEGTTGTSTITVTVTDPDGNTSQRSFTVTIQADTVDTDPWLADVPKIRTLEGVGTEFDLSHFDPENSAVVYLDQGRLQQFGLFVPQPTPTGLTYATNPTTGVTTVSPGALMGTQRITVAVGVRTAAIDYQVVPIEIVTTPSNWLVTVNDFPASGAADDGEADTIRLVRNETRLEVYVNNVLTAQAEDVSVSSITLAGSGDDDRLIIDWSGGNPLPQGGLIFSGGSQTTSDGDVLELTGGSATSITHTFADGSSGTINIDGIVIQYGGLEPIIDRLTASTRTFTFSSLDDVVTLGDDGIASNGLSRISTTSGTAERVDFAGPTGSLTVNLGGGNDNLTVLAIDSGNYAVTVDGGAGNDTIRGGNAADHISGGTGHDNLIGLDGNDTILGEDGNDTINGGGGADSLSGGAGNDNVAGIGASDFLSGGPGNDTLDGGAGTDRVLDGMTGALITLTNVGYNGEGVDVYISIERVGLTGDDTSSNLDATQFSGAVTVLAGGGDDTIRGTASDDSLDGGSGNDSLDGMGGNDTVIGSDGDDILQGNSGSDSVSGGNGRDLVRGGGGSGDTVSGGLDDDTLDGGAGTDSLFETTNGNLTLTSTTMTGLGNDVLLNVERARLVGGNARNIFDASAFNPAPGLTSVIASGGGGNDLLIGSPGADIMDGDDGDDVLIGNDGNDQLLGDRGRDRLEGGGGNDLLEGAQGSGDSISGGPGNDTINGGAGTDRVYEIADVNFVLTSASLTGLGTDTLIGIERAALTGGAGNNTIDASGFGGSGTTLDGGAGNDSVLGSASVDVIIGGDGDDTLIGNAGNDTIMAGTGNDSVDGGAGNDGLSGFSGNDQIIGGADNDTIYGGSGNDTLTGGDGADTIVGGAGGDSVNGEGGTDKVLGGSGSGANPFDSVIGSAGEIDENFQLNPLPVWVEEV